MQHILKTDPKPFDFTRDGLKTFELRFDDRNYMVDDQLILLKTLFSSEEMKRGSGLYYTGDALRVKVTHIIRGPAYGLVDGWVMMSIIILKN